MSESKSEHEARMATPAWIVDSNKARLESLKKEIQSVLKNESLGMNLDPWYGYTRDTHRGFVMSGESGSMAIPDEDPELNALFEDSPVADYWGTHGPWINPTLEAILKNHNAGIEWYDAGTLHVYLESTQEESQYWDLIYTAGRKADTLRATAPAGFSTNQIYTRPPTITSYDGTQVTTYVGLELLDRDGTIYDIVNQTGKGRFYELMPRHGTRPTRIGTRQIQERIDKGLIIVRESSI